MINESEISIIDILALLWSKVIILVIALIVGAGAAFGYTELFMPLKYSSHISMYVQSYTDISDDNNNYNDISKSKQLINTYIQVLKDDAVMESVGKALTKQFDETVISENFSVSDGKIQPSSLASVISISTVTDTSAVNIVATTGDPELSAAICNELCRQANQFTTRAIGVGKIKSIDTAKAFYTPVAPNKIKNTAIGGIAALILAALIIFMIDFFDNTIKSPEILQKKYQKAILGEIDDMSLSSGKKHRNKPENERMTLLKKDVPFQIAESFKSMRTNIMFALSTSENKIFAISSANPSEGKSTTAVNIAITLAEGGQKVLLIDADMRKPVQHKIFEIKNDKGLSSVLSRMETADQCIQNTKIPNLNILPSGSIPPNPSELLASENASELLKILSETYDSIIIDTPPINMVSDALNLSRSIAGILVVVRYGSTTDEELKNTVNKINLAQMNLLGFVLNDIRKDHKGSYYSHYGKYGYREKYAYGYGHIPERRIEEEIIEKSGEEVAQESKEEIAEKSGEEVVQESKEEIAEKSGEEVAQESKEEIAEKSGEEVAQEFEKKTEQKEEKP